MFYVFHLRVSLFLYDINQDTIIFHASSLYLSDSQFVYSLHPLRELLILTNTDGKIHPYGFNFKGIFFFSMKGSEKIITKLQLR